MDLLDQLKIEQEVKKTIDGLAERETSDFTDWPNDSLSETEYELERGVEDDSQHPSNSGFEGR